MSSRFSPLLAIAVIGLIGCNRSNLNARDLVGTWVMKATSRQVLPAGLKSASPRIVLREDGTFDASEMPGLLYADRRSARLDTGDGKWKLVSREGGQDVQVNFDSIKAGSTELPLPYGTQIMVSKFWSNVSLEYYIGDQDEGLRVEFEKK